MKIYCVEDDAGIRNLMVYTLQSTGFSAVGFPDSGSFWQGISSELPGLVLLDIMLPGEDGLAILQKLRATPRTARIPVIMATAKGTEYDKVIGLDSGADDYVTKPFGTMELIARVKALLRRTEPVTDEKEYRIGQLYLCPAKHIIRAGDENVTLTLKEFELLCLLVQNKGKVFTRDAILRDIWGYEFDGENRTVDVHIRTLRSKLKECGSLIETIRGIGYRIGGAD